MNNFDMTEQTIVERILAEIDRQGLTIAEAARRSGVNYDVLRDMKRGKTVGTDWAKAQKIATGLGLDLSGEQSLPANFDAAELVPVYNVDASAGHGAITDWEEGIVDRLAFPPNYLRKITSGKLSDLRIIGVKGDSMTPTLSDNDLVMIDRSKRDLSFDGLFVLRDGGASLLVKRVGRGTRSGTITLISDNRTYRDTERAIEDIEVIGKVVWRGVKE